MLFEQEPQVYLSYIRDSDRMTTISSISNTKFDGQGVDIWKDYMQGILFFKDCEDALQVNKPE